MVEVLIVILRGSLGRVLVLSFRRGNSASATGCYFGILKDLPPSPPRTTGIVCQMRHTLPGHRFKVVHRNCESDDLEIGGDHYAWIWIDRYLGDYLSGRVARTRFVIAKSRSCWKSGT
jgi:hypothetical protein